MPRQPIAVYCCLPLLSGALLAGCAAQPTEFAQTFTPENSAAYTLNEKELKLDCKDLTGRMKLRILQIRDANSDRSGTLAARGLQTAATTVFGGGKEGADPAGQYARDRAQLEAYNKQLAAKKCKTFDLDAELRPKPHSESPTPR